MIRNIVVPGHAELEERFRGYQSFSIDPEVFLGIPCKLRVRQKIDPKSRVTIKRELNVKNDGLRFAVHQGDGAVGALKISYDNYPLLLAVVYKDRMERGWPFVRT